MTKDLGKINIVKKFVDSWTAQMNVYAELRKFGYHNQTLDYVYSFWREMKDELTKLESDKT